MAFLVSESRMGSARYPSMAVASALADLVKSCGQKTALHLCGGVASAILQGRTRALPGFFDLLSKIDRVQINVSETMITDESIQRAQGILQKPLIFQWRQLEFPQARVGIQWLYDVSGGLGIEPSAWPSLPQDQVVGLAGGLGPGKVYPLLQSLENDLGGYWMDMESSLRDSQDRFSVDACFQVLEQVQVA